MRIDTIVVGAGQAGLTMSHALSKRGIAHVVLERARIAERWRSERWDSLRFQFPNWAMRLPDHGYTGDRLDEYAPRDEVVRFIEAYAASIDAPVRAPVDVRALHRDNDLFRLETSDGPMHARNVVVATGPYQRPAVPAFAERLRGVEQFNASDYRAPDQLPAGGVLVVGSGASGCQIAEELLLAGRDVVLAVGPHRRVPRRYRGKDFIWWISALGMDERPVDEAVRRQPPLVLSGAYGGRTIDFRRYAADGMRLAGRMIGADGAAATFADDLNQVLAGGDAAYAGFVAAADAHAAELGFPVADPPSTFPEPVGLTRLDLTAENIGSIVWCTGYRYDFGWVRCGAIGDDGAPIHRLGVASVPGLYFLGLPMLSKTKSSFLSGVGEDAERLADLIAGHTNRRGH